MSQIKLGAAAPDFKTSAYVNGEFKDVSLKDFKGKWVCLYFYPLDFTFVCPTEIRAFGEFEKKFREEGCEIIGCSTDSVFSHKNWFENDAQLKGMIHHPVLADTSHTVSRDYGVLIEEKGITFRGTFLIDPSGNLQWMTVNALGVGRNVEEVLRTLQALKTGENCPVGWKPGQKTLGK